MRLYRSAWLALFFVACAHVPPAPPVLSVKPGDDIQGVIDAAARMNPRPVIHFSAGTYRPSHVGQALIYLNRVHDGLTLMGEKGAVLSAENGVLVSPRELSYPAAVSHVIYVGDGVSDKTKISGFRITGARGRISHDYEARTEPNHELPRTVVFYADGGGLKVFGRASPVLEALEFVDNHAFYCGGAISVEQRGLASTPLVIRDSVFISNDAPLTGGAVDILPGSRVVMENVFFRDNFANLSTRSIDERRKAHARLFGRRKFPRAWIEEVPLGQFERSAALTVFAGSSLELKNATFLENGGALEWSPNVAWYWKKSAVPPEAGGLSVTSAIFAANRQYALRLRGDPLHFELRGSYFDGIEPLAEPAKGNHSSQSLHFPEGASVPQEAVPAGYAPSPRSF